MNTFEDLTLAPAIRTLVSKLYRRLRHQVKTADSLSLSEITLLSNLYHFGSLYPSQMADILKIKAQSISQIINKLDELKLIIKTPSSDDKRKVAISLSEHGRQLVDQTRHQRDEWLSNAIAKQLTTEEQALVAKAIALLDKVAEHN